MSDPVHPRRDWTRAGAWPSDHAVAGAFRTLRTDAMEDKGRGVLILPPRLDPRSATTLGANLARLLAAIPGNKFAIRRARILAAMAEPGVPSDPELAEWRPWAFMLGVSPGAFDAAEAAAAGRDLVLAQLLAMRPGVIPDPIRSILFATAHVAIHRALSLNIGKTEPQVTEALVLMLRTALDGNIIAAVEAERASLPPGLYLDLASASLQGHHDPFGADLAIAVGAWVDGRPRYRVVLLQAKVASATGLANVGHDDGAQITQLHATGVGYYLFHPLTDERHGFIATVRPASEVLAEAWGAGVPPRYSGIDVRCGSGDAAWDFATFLAIGLTDPDTHPGELLFDGPEQVANFLTEPGRRPLANRLLAFDLTRRLRVTEIVPRGYRADPPLSVPADGDFDPADEPDVPGGTYGR